MLFAECQEHNSKHGRRLVFEELILCCKKKWMVEWEELGEGDWQTYISDTVYETDN